MACAAIEPIYIHDDLECCRQGINSVSCLADLPAQQQGSTGRWLGIDTTSIHEAPALSVARQTQDCVSGWCSTWCGVILLHAVSAHIPKSAHMTCQKDMLPSQ